LKIGSRVSDPWVKGHAPCKNRVKGENPWVKGLSPLGQGTSPLRRRDAESAESFLIGFNLRALSRGLESIFTENALAIKFYVETRPHFLPFS